MSSLIYISVLSVTAVSGFPKPGSSYNIDNILKGQIGDDAYFVARHVDEWSTDFNETSDEEPAAERCRGNADVIGVADGVGGWRAYGVDPGLFSVNLMKCCERLVIAGYFSGNQPAKLLAQVQRNKVYSYQWIRVIHSPGNTWVEYQSSDWYSTHAVLFF